MVFYFDRTGCCINKPSDFHKSALWFGDRVIKRFLRNPILYTVYGERSLQVFRLIAESDFILCPDCYLAYSQTTSKKRVCSYEFHQSTQFELTFDTSISRQDSVVTVVTRLWAGICAVRIPGGARDISLFKKSRPTLVHTQNSIQRAQSFFPWGGRGVELTTHLHPQPRLKNKWCYTSTPLYVSTAWRGKTLAYYLYSRVTGFQFVFRR